MIRDQCESISAHLTLGSLLDEMQENLFLSVVKQTFMLW